MQIPVILCINCSGRHIVDWMQPAGIVSTCYTGQLTCDMILTLNDLLDKPLSSNAPVSPWGHTGHQGAPGGRHGMVIQPINVNLSSRTMEIMASIWIYPTNGVSTSKIFIDIFKMSSLKICYSHDVPKILRIL